MNSGVMVPFVGHHSHYTLTHGLRTAITQPLIHPTIDSRTSAEHAAPHLNSPDNQRVRCALLWLRPCRTQVLKPDALLYRKLLTVNKGGSSPDPAIDCCNMALLLAARYTSTHSIPQTNARSPMTHNVDTKRPHAMHELIQHCLCCMCVQLLNEGRGGVATAPSGATTPSSVPPLPSYSTVRLAIASSANATSRVGGARGDIHVGDDSKRGGDSTAVAKLFVAHDPGEQSIWRRVYSRVHE